MAADDLSTANLPPVSWATNTSPRESNRDALEKEKKPRPISSKAGAKQPALPEVEFEQTEHELDSIA